MVVSPVIRPTDGMVLLVFSYSSNYSNDSLALISSNYKSLNF